MTIIIQSLNTINTDLLNILTTGYVSHEKYQVSWQDTGDVTLFQLQLVALETPYEKQFDLEDAAYYENILSAGLSCAAYDDANPVAIALADRQQWNNSFWIHDFHVSKNYQGQGIGRHLMTALIEKARSVSARTIVCETQNTNIPAIRFYRRMGFRIEAFDTSLYTNDDYPDGEIALFMKRHTEIPTK